MNKFTLLALPVVFLTVSLCTTEATTVTERYEDEEIILSLGTLDVAIGPTHIRRISNNLHNITDNLYFFITASDYKVIISQAPDVINSPTPKPEITARTLRYLSNGKEVTLKGFIKGNNGGKWRFTNSVKLSDDTTLDITYAIKELVHQPDAFYLYVENKLQPTTYRDLIPFLSSNPPPTSFSIPYATHYGSANWEVKILGLVTNVNRIVYGDPIPWATSIQYVRGYAPSVDQHLIYDLKEILKLNIWQLENSSYKVTTAAQSILSAQFGSTCEEGTDDNGSPRTTRQKVWYERTDEEIRNAIKKVSKHIDLIQFYTWPGFDHTRDAFGNNIFVEKLQSYIDNGHLYKLDIGYQITRFRYPHCYGDVFKKPELNSFYAQRLAIGPEGKFTRILEPSPGAAALPSSDPVLDIANRSAVEYMARQFKDHLNQIRDLSYLWWDEETFPVWLGDVKQDDFNDHYFESPTYSNEALKWFQEFMNTKYGVINAKFPVHNSALIGSLGTLLVTAGPSNGLWDRWLEWRETVFANWLDAMARAAKEANEENPYYKGAIYFCSSNDPWKIIGSVNHGKRLSGVNLDLILSSPNITWLVMEEDGGNTDLQKAEWEIRSGKEIAESHQKKFGTYVLADHYYAKPRQNILPERLVEQIRMGLEAGAEMMVVHTDGPFVNRMCDPSLNSGNCAGHYDPSLSKLWDGLRFAHMYELPNLLSPRNEEILQPDDYFSWTDTKDAVGYQIEVTFPFQGTLPLKKIYLDVKEPFARASEILTLLPPPMPPFNKRFTWRVRAKFVIENENLFDPNQWYFKEIIPYWGSFSNSRIFNY